MKRLQEPVPAEGTIVRQVPRAPRVFNAQVGREVDAGLCEQSDVRQSVAGIVVGEKNRCLPMAQTSARSACASRPQRASVRRTYAAWMSQLRKLSRLRSHL